MKLREFLRTKTRALELCVIRESGWIVATCFIDHEDLFCRHLDNKLGDMEVKNDKWEPKDKINAENIMINTTAKANDFNMFLNSLLFK